MTCPNCGRAFGHVWGCGNAAPEEDQRLANDCMRGSVAALLGLPYEDVPHFVELAGQDAWLALAWWCDWRGLVFDWDSDDPGVPCIAKGPSPRGGGKTHAVVWYDVAVAMDPHPSRAGLDGEPSMYALIRPKDERDAA